VHDHVGWPTAAIAVTWPADADRDGASLAEAVARAAADLSRRLYAPAAAG